MKIFSMFSFNRLTLILTMIEIQQLHRIVIPIVMKIYKQITTNTSGLTNHHGAFLFLRKLVRLESKKASMRLRRKSPNLFFF